MKFSIEQDVTIEDFESIFNGDNYQIKKDDENNELVIEKNIEQNTEYDVIE